MIISQAKPKEELILNSASEFKKKFSLAIFIFIMNKIAFGMIF